MTPLDTLLGQAHRLRFSDAELEQEFRAQRQTEAVLRVRVMAAAGLLYVAVAGLQSVLRIAPWSPEWAGWVWHYRFAGVGPLWLALFLSTFLPGHVRRAEWLYPVATAGALIGLALMNMGLGVMTARNIGSGLMVDFGLVMIASFTVLPMRFRWMAVAAVAALGFDLLLAYLILPAVIMGTGTVALMLLLITITSLALGWGRERTDRVLFAQHQHVRQLAERLDARGKELARMNAEKSEFMAVAAHDLRAPLGLVRGTLELLRAGAFGDPARRDEALDRAEQETGRMLNLVDDYLGAYAAERGALQVERKRIDLGVVAAAGGARHAALAAKKQQTLVVDAPIGRTWVWGDEDLLGQVADNFITNALKFAAPGTVVTVELLEAVEAGVARLAVVDAGPGVAPEVQSRLFQQFGRLGHQTTGGESSTGLGLAVVKRLAEAMGGRVGCDSPVHADGTGARFWVELPLATAADGAGPA